MNPQIGIPGFLRSAIPIPACLCFFVCLYVEKICVCVCGCAAMLRRVGRVTIVVETVAVDDEGVA